MKTIYHYAILLFMMTIPACSSPRTSIDRTNVVSKNAASATNEVPIPLFVKIINTGSPDVRAQAELKMFQIKEDRDASEETKTFIGDILRFRWKVEKGETSPQEFEAYCKSVEILIGDFMKAWEAKTRLVIT